MRTVAEYIQLAKDKYNKEKAITNISMRECVELIVDNAFFEDEITAPIIDPLKDKILEKLKSET